MKLDSLESLKDDELQAVIGRSNELLQERDRQRKSKALGEARALLESVGLSLKDLASTKPQKNGSTKGPTYHTGRQYQHPVNKALTWNAKGQKPNWLRELEAEGGKAVEVRSGV
jgi:DNA-binding protein H-NS